VTTTDASLDGVLRQGYGFDDDAVILGRPLDPALDRTLNEHFVQVPLRMLSRHASAGPLENVPLREAMELQTQGGDSCFREPDRPELVFFFDNLGR
jgi:hypothetical protein